VQHMPRLPNALVLCGGAGMRLRSVTGASPKVMADVSGQPFMELLLRQLQRHGFEHVILAVGYQRESIRAYFGDRASGLEVRYSVESMPLGTGGAMRNAVDLIETDTALIMNGDSYTDVDLCKFVTEHRESKADVSIVVVRADQRDDVGTVRVDVNCRVVAFDEKRGAAGTRWVNAGIYTVSRALLYDIDPGVCVSLEHELFPRWLAERRDIRAFFRSAACIDIGTPERYRVAQEALLDVESKPGAWGKADQ